MTESSNGREEDGDKRRYRERRLRHKEKAPNRVGAYFFTTSTLPDLKWPCQEKESARVPFLSVEAPDFNPGEHAFRRAEKAQARDGLQPPALRPVAQPFLAVRLWSAGSPLTAFFAIFRFLATRLPRLP